MQIRAKAVLVDAKGRPIINPKTKAPRMGFSDWTPKQQDSAAQGLYLGRNLRLNC